MIAYRIIHGILFAACLALGLLVYFHNSQRTVNQYFLMLTATLSLWLGFMMLAFQSSAAASSAFYVQATNGAALFVPYIFDCMRLAIAHPSLSFRKILFHHPLWLLACFVMAAICQTTFFLQAMELPSDPSQGVPVPQYGPGIILYTLYFLSTLFAMAYLYFREARNAPGIVRTELQYVLLSWAAGTIVGVMFSVLIPVATGNPQAVQLLPVTALIILAIIAYGIATRRIMDVPYILRRLTAYALVTLYLALVYIAVWHGAGYVFRLFSPESQLPAQLLAALVTALSMAPANGRMQQFANRIFLSIQTLDLATTLQRSNRILSSIATREELLDQFASLVATSLGTDRVIILLAENEVFLQRHPKIPPNTQPIRLNADNPLVLALEQSGEPLVMDVLSRFRANPVEKAATAVMLSLQASLAIGVNPKSGVRSLILLGPRLSGRIYGASEQRAIQLLGNQLAVGLENAELYTRIQDGAIYNNILLDSLVSGVIAAGADQRITVYNREAQRVIQMTPNQILHQPIDRLPDPIYKALQSTFELNHGSRDVETTLHRPGHEDTHIRLGTSFFHSHTGKTLGVLLVFDDLTAIKKLESQVRRTDRLASLGTLSAGMAHEIKNPLVTLKTFTQLLPERYEDPDFRTTFSNLVGEEVKRIDSIVNQLLRFARPAKPSLSPTHIHEVIDNTLRLVQQQLKQKNITLHKDYQVPSDLIQGDNNLLVQAFLNFFLNAVDAMDQGGELFVTTTLREQESGQTTFLGVPSTEACLCLCIRDSGKGIKGEDIPHVFDPFFTTKSSGTGLGLSVSHGIIHEHHGLIDVESKLGVGTTFTILFPLLRKEALA